MANGMAAKLPAGKAVSKIERVRTLDALGYRDYRLLWYTQVGSSMGQWMENVARDWLVYQMTDSAWMVGLINAARAVPMIFLGLFGGVVADMVVNRRQILIVTKTINLLLTLLMAVLISMGRIEVWHIFAITVGIGMAMAFEQPARNALIPNLVPSDKLMNAVALNSAALNSSRIVGPAIGGFLVTFFGVAGAYYARGFLYVFVLLGLFMMVAPERSVFTRRESIGKNMVDGLSYVRNNQTVFTLLVLAVVPMLFSMNYRTLMPVFARDILEIGAGGMGLLLSATGVGSLTGAVVVASLGDFKHKGKLLLAGMMVAGSSLVLFSASPWLAGSVLFMATFGFADQCYTMINQTLMQGIITDDFRGRVMSVYALDRGLQSAGALMAGGVAELAGAPLTMAFLGAVNVVVATGVALRMPFIRRLK